MIANYPLSRFRSDAVLIIRLDAIGDFIIWLDSAKVIRALYPDKRIILCANSVWASLAVHFPYWDEVIPVELQRLENDLVYRFKFFWRIRLQRFQVAIQPIFSRVYLQGDSLIRASGSIQRIGSMGDLSNISQQHKEISDKWYTWLIQASPVTLMEIVRNAEFVRGLGAKDFLGSVAKIDTLLDLPTKLKIAKPYCVIFPGASITMKMWSTAKFIEVIAHIYQTFGFRIVLCGGFGDMAVCAEIAAKSTGIITNLAGKTSLAELVEVIRHSRILIGNDTSVIHIAAAVGTPSVCILGGGHFGRFLPYAIEKPSFSPMPIAVFKKMDCFGCNWQCKYPLKAGCPPCITDIEVEQVLAAWKLAATDSTIHASS